MTMYREEPWMNMVETPILVITLINYVSFASCLLFQPSSFKESAGKNINKNVI